MNIELLMYGVFIVASLTSLTTEVIKKLATGKPENVIALLSSLIISLSIGTGYLVYNGLPFTNKAIIDLICLAFMSVLVSMLGYDKVMQTLKQIKEKK